MGRLKRSGRVEVTTEATPEQVWSVIADVTRIGEWSHECGVGVWLDGESTAHRGARFTGSNRVGKMRWSRVCEIVSADPTRELVWRTVPKGWFRDSTEWCILLEPDGDQTRIIQTFDVLALNPVMERLIHITTPAHRDRLPALAEDLARLGQVAAADHVARPTAS